MYDNSKPFELWDKPKNIRVIKLAFDEVIEEKDHFIFIVNGSCVAKVECAALNTKTRSKLKSLS